ncbi:Uma2 family endonuclease [Kitasatospora sp. NPDC057198]|uniref:Uma2 family endonuclease n=1 Tax=Kitasatospora sp. NPDC057198 TaxID=3346046 RepID=UPI0036276A22
MSGLPDWMRPPRPEGWLADDLDHLPQAPPHTELLHGALLFDLLPRPPFHDHAVDRLADALTAPAPAGVRIARAAPLRLDPHNRFEPDILLVSATPARTRFSPGEVLLAIEVASPESAYRDHEVKPRKYAEAGIPHYWCVGEEAGRPVVHVFEQAAPAGVFRGALSLSAPFAVTIDLDRLVPRTGAAP